MGAGRPPGQRASSRAFSRKKSLIVGAGSRNRDKATKPAPPRFRPPCSRSIEQAPGRMQNRSPIMLNATGEGPRTTSRSRAEPRSGRECRYGAPGFFPVPLQGTQTLRCPRALMLPTPRQWGQASCSARASSDGAAIRFPKVISSSFSTSGATRGISGRAGGGPDPVLDQGRNPVRNPKGQSLMDRIPKCSILKGGGRRQPAGRAADLPRKRLAADCRRSPAGFNAPSASRTERRRRRPKRLRGRRRR
jgi:hypothetical protein